jgi:predicted ATP-grasp superfamily ATP-dependent carboligase
MLAAGGLFGSTAARNAAEIPDTKVGAVVLGGDYQGLGIVRSLGRRAIPVRVLDDEYSIARFSRYASGGMQVETLGDSEKTAAVLLDAGRRLGLDGWVLYPTRDETVAAISRHRSDLAQVFRVPTPEWSTVRLAWDKREAYRLADKLGIPTPRTWYADHPEQLESVESDGPFVIKPASKGDFFRVTKAKAWRANGRDELVTRFKQGARLVPPGQLMVQEFIPGDGRQQFAYCAFFKNGEAVGSMTVRRWRQHPPDFGRASTFVETIDLPVLATLSERFLRAIDYYGLIELEYKLDCRDGRYKLLDVNPRTWGYHSLGQDAGVDFPHLLFADQLDRPVDSCRARVGRRWIRLVTDLPTGLAEIRSGDLDWRAYLRSLSFDTEAVFSREDPLPGLIEVALLPYLYVKRGF